MAKKQKKKILITIIIFLLLIVAFFGIFKIQNRILQILYPKKYADYVYQYSEENRIDPLLTFAMIKAESNFKEDAVSKSGAKGLMQLMDATAKETANKLQMEYEENTLYHAESNIKLGTKYFSTLMEKYKNIPVALTAYNAGTGNVDKWIENDTIQEDGSDIENIPFRETNHYVRKILRDYEIYKKIYEN